MSIVSSVYAKAPVRAQNAAVSAYGLYWRLLRFGPGFQRHVRRYLSRNELTAEGWAEWQASRLREMLKQCARHVPYYSANWTASEKLAAERGELQDLPLLTKDPVRDEPRAFLNGRVWGYPRSRTYTSGSTGTPVANYWTLADVRRRLAVREARANVWAGVSFSQGRATFSGRMVVPGRGHQGPFHRFNRAESQVYFSAFHLNPTSVDAYASALDEHRPVWMTGYAVSIYLFARLLIDSGYQLKHRLRAIITTSEPLSELMRTTIQEAFQCRVYEEYGTVENAVLACECPAGRLHISPDVSVVEILRSDGTACEPGEPGAVTVTTLARELQPLVRYRIGDVATWAAEACRCGSGMPVLQQVDGRLEDVVIGADGSQMVRFHGVFIDQPHVQEGQIIQETRQLIRVLVVPKEGFGEADVADIRNRVRTRVGELEVEVQTVPEIPRTSAGKFRAVISHVSV